MSFTYELVKSSHSSSVQWRCTLSVLLTPCGHAGKQNGNREKYKGKASTVLSWQGVIRLVSVLVSEYGGAVVRPQGPWLSVQADVCHCDPRCLQSELDVVILLLVWNTGQVSVAFPAVMALKGLSQNRCIKVSGVQTTTTRAFYSWYMVALITLITSIIYINRNWIIGKLVEIRTNESQAGTRRKCGCWLIRYLREKL